MKKYPTKLTIVIPTYNEELVIEETLRSIEKAVITPHEIVIIDDSTDKTENVVKKYARNRPNIRFIKNKTSNKGFSRSIKRALKEMGSQVVVIMMGDLCDDPKTIDPMYSKLQEGWDIVCGSRYIKGGKKIGGPKLQDFLSRFVCKGLYLLTAIPTQDISNNFKMYQKEILDNVRFNPTSGVETSMEITFQAFFKGAKIVEIPTTWKGRTLGKSKFKLFHRIPKYTHILYWALENSLRKTLGIKLRRFYV